MARSTEEIKRDITTLTRVPSVFINEKLKELADEVEGVYQQGRADAIDEFVEKADSAIYEDFNKTDVGEYTITDVGLTIRRVAEQLKEK